MTAVIIANFDCEYHWAQQYGIDTTLTSRATRAMELFAQALTVFAGPNDVIVPSLAQIPEGTTEVLPWGQTRQLDQLRRHHPCLRSGPWHELWRYWAPSEITAAVNHRRFVCDLDDEIDTDYPSHWVEAPNELDAWLDRFEVGRASWVVKAPFSSAGRDTVLGRPDRPTARTQAQALLRKWNGCVVEPWAEREQDYGCCGVVHSDTKWTTMPPHLLHCDSRGRFRGVTTMALNGETSSVKGTIKDNYRAVAPALTRTAQLAAQKLAAAGYRGPFSIDGFTYRHANTVKLRTLCEINARMSFGWVAHAYARNRSVSFMYAPKGELPHDSVTIVAGRKGAALCWVNDHISLP